MIDFGKKAGYAFRRIGGGILCFLICSFVLAVSIPGFVKTATRNQALLSLIEGTTAREVVFSGTDEGEESFLCLNGENNFLSENDLRINADLLMSLPNRVYKDNLIGFAGALADGECYVSGNLMRTYDLRIGDLLTTTKEGAEYRIVGVLPAQNGLDQKYDHAGMVVLAYDEAIADHNSGYVSFLESGEQYSNLKDILFIAKTEKAARTARLDAVIKILGATVVAVVLLEWLLGRRARRNYGIMAFDGVPPFEICRKISVDFLSKYFSAVLAASAYCFAGIREYGEACIRVLLLYVTVVFAALLLAAISVGRTLTCRKK